MAAVWRPYITQKDFQMAKQVYLSEVEKELVETFQEVFGINYLDAVEQVIKIKREEMFRFERSGMIEHAQKLREELGE